MKSNIKIIFAFIIGMLVSGVVVYAAVMIDSKDVLHVPNNQSWNVSTVDEAITDIYSSISYGNAKANDIKAGKTALVGGKKIVGTNDIMSYGDATADDILEGKTAVVNGEKITGTKTNTTFYTAYNSFRTSQNPYQINTSVISYSLPSNAQMLGITGVYSGGNAVLRGISINTTNKTVTVSMENGANYIADNEIGVRIIYVLN